tara:strand:- start:8564 stop:9085 length:522 start_codon:yes stop_codon:yes gene_type:complete
MALKKIGRLSLKKASLADVEPIANNMRMSDRQELTMLEVEPLQALVYPWTQKNTTTYTIFADSLPIAMLGTGWDGSLLNHAKVWMLATKDLKKHSIPFLKGSRDVVKLLQGSYDLIYNYVPVSDHETIEWLLWCGFYFESEVVKINSYPFLKFIRCHSSKNSFNNKESRPVMH